MSVWPATSSEFPRDVRGLFNMYNNNINNNNNNPLLEPADKKGLEKRLEYILKRPTRLTRNDFIPVLEALECHSVEGQADIEGAKGGQYQNNNNNNNNNTNNNNNNAENVLFILCDKCLLVVTLAKVVLIANADVAIHHAVLPLQAALEGAGAEVEWVSFIRKNTAAPWASQADSQLAAEYSELKSAFPTGNSFLLGPIDADHYFYYVYDAQTLCAKELQVNMVLHDITIKPQHLAQYGLCSVGKCGGILQRCRSSAPGSYEVLRVLNHGDECHLSYETNNQDFLQSDEMAELVAQFNPARFSLKCLVDPQCPVAEVVAKRVTTFTGYAQENRTCNEFLNGYTVDKTSFVRVQ